jgi:DNA recombination protein RmuC
LIGEQSEVITVNEWLLIVLIVLIGLNFLLSVLLLRRIRQDPVAGLITYFDAVEKGQERTERLVREEIGRSREETSTTAKEGREELRNSIIALGESSAGLLARMSTAQKDQLDIFSGQLSSLSVATQMQLDTVRTTIEQRLSSLQEDNSKKLDQMREVVDEKLHATLERRLGESFNLVAERLTEVHRGLGEMQQLATGVGDLKRVLTNVRSRGAWGEVQLGYLLEQILANGQFDRNVVTKSGSSERVEFALRLPGQEGAGDREVFLPIDAKFPKETYERLVDAQEVANLIQVEEASKQLDRAIREMAKNIRDKYLDPPNTTDFGIMYLPTEGLFAEVVRRTGLCEVLQRDYRVMVAGPTTLAALLNCLQLGFRTLAIAKRSGEVWGLLGEVKTEFGRFGDILDKTHKKLGEASHTIEDAVRKSRTIERKLREVQQLPSSTQPLLEALEEETDLLPGLKGVEEN